MIPTPVGQDLLLPLDDMMKRYNLTADMFAPGIYNAGVSDGVNYAIPFRTAPSVLMYNKTMFDAAGVDYPYDNMPLDEFLEICKKLTKPDGSQFAYGIAGSKSDPANVLSSFCPAIWGSGGDFLTEDLSQSAFNTPESIAGVKYWVELYTKHKVVPEGCINYATTKDLVPMFFNQQIAMVQMNDSNVFKAQDYAKEGGYEVGMCVQQGTYSRGGGWSFTIPVTAKNVEGAEMFMDFFIKPEVIGEQKVVMPGVIEAQKTSEYWSNPTFDMYYKAEEHTKVLPFHPKWTEIQNIIVMELQEALQGNGTPEEAAQRMHEKINALIAK
jgi:multiple sugar transport system substrate-binding protein